MSRGSGTILFGGSGFLGPHILAKAPEMISVGRTPPHANNRHIHIDSLDRLDALSELDFDKVVYVIGNTEHKQLEREVIPPGEMTAFDYHVVLLHRTLEQLKQRPLKKFIHFSTVLLYDTARLTLPVPETGPVNPFQSRYVLSKHMAEELAQFYSKQAPIVTLRLANLYGPTHLRRVDLIHMLCRQLIETGKVEMWTTRPERDFIYVEDAAEAVLRLLGSDFSGTLNLGSGVMTSTQAVKEVLEQVGGVKIHVKDVPVTGPMKFQCDISALRRAIDWSPQVPFAEGLRETYQRMRALIAP